MCLRKFKKSYFNNMLIPVLCHLLMCYHGGGWKAGVFKGFRIKSAQSHLFLNEPDFLAFCHIYGEKDHAKPFKAISLC